MDVAMTNRFGFFYMFLAGADLALDEGLESAVTVSLFTDRLALPTDVIPDGTQDRRGHWSDSYLAVVDDKEGSRLWLLSREKVMDEVLRRGEDYAREALAWMVEDGVAKSITPTAWTTGKGDFNLRVRIEKPDGNAVEYAYLDLWRNQANAV